MGNIDKDRIMRIPLKAIEKPRDGHCDVFVNWWWTYDPKSDSVIFYQRHKPQYSSAQCHKNKGIAEKIFGLVWKPFGFEMRQIPVAYVPIWFTGDVDFGYQLGRLLVPDEPDF